MNLHSSIGLESWDLGGAGDCFFHCIAPLVGMIVLELRLCQHMRDNEQIYGGLGDFHLNLTGDIELTCDLVSTCGFYVQDNE